MDENETPLIKTIIKPPEPKAIAKPPEPKAITKPPETPKQKTSKTSDPKKEDPLLPSKRKYNKKSSSQKEKANIQKELKR